MNIKSKHKIDTGFSMSSMTDIIFLLLIFFTLAASFVTPVGLPVDLPTSKTSDILSPKINVTITSALSYYVGEQKVALRELESVLRKALDENKRDVVLHVDKSVAVEHLIKVAGIATSLHAKVSVATKSE
ncbi:MAG: biopolymer transporter ExbD [Cytophagales bacterium]|nr:biopolymer transporter ExbD [Cytophagales bacterium]